MWLRKRQAEVTLPDRSAGVVGTQLVMEEGTMSNSRGLVQGNSATNQVVSGPGSGPDSATNQLYDVAQVTFPFWALVTFSTK